MSRVGGKARIEDLRESWVAEEGLGERQSVRRVAFHSTGERTQSAQDEPRVERARGPPEPAAGLPDALEELAVARAGEDERSAEHVAVAAQVLGRRVQHEVGAERQRPLQGRRGEGPVDQEAGTCGVGGVGEAAEGRGSRAAGWSASRPRPARGFAGDAGRPRPRPGRPGRRTAAPSPSAAGTRAPAGGRPSRCPGERARCAPAGSDWRSVEAAAMPEAKASAPLEGRRRRARRAPLRGGPGSDFPRAGRAGRGAAPTRGRGGRWWRGGSEERPRRSPGRPLLRRARRASRSACGESNLPAPPRVPRASSRLSCPSARPRACRTARAAACRTAPSPRASSAR